MGCDKLDGLSEDGWRVPRDDARTVGRFSSSQTREFVWVRRVDAEGSLYTARRTMYARSDGDEPSAPAE